MRPPRSLGRGFTCFWAANSISGLGDGITQAAGPLLIASITHDPRLISGAIAAQQLPTLLLALPMGAIVDRLDKRRVALLSDAVRTLVMTVLASLVVGGHATVLAIYVLLVVEGLGIILDRTTASALVKELVAEPDLPTANSRQFAANTLGTFLIGPPVGALLFVADRWVPFAIDAVSFGASFVLVAAIRWREPDHERVAQSVRADALDGLRWLWAHPALRTLSLCMFVMNLCFGGVTSVLVIYAHRQLHQGDKAFGLLVTAIAVGGLVGSPFVSRMMARWGIAWLLRVGLCVEALTHVGLAYSTHLWAALLVLFAFGVHDVFWNVTTSTLRQREAPAHMQGRSSGVYAVFSIGGNALGALLAGFVVRAYGIRAPFLISAVIVGLLVVVAWRPFAHTDA